MSFLLPLALVSVTWLPRERSDIENHPVIPLSSLFADDTALAYDVEHYELDLEVDIPAETLSAQAGVTFRMLEAADTVVFDFVGMSIADIKEGTIARSFNRVDSCLTVDLARTVSKGSVVVLKVSYHGKPTIASSGFGRGVHIDSRNTDDAVTYTCSAPWGAKYWFPCQDNPADKATMEMTVSVPSGYEVISNGKLSSATRTGPRWSFHWQENHPIATYLIAFAASKNYALNQDTAMIGPTPLPLFHWVLRKDSTEITPKFMAVKEIAEYFSQLFYPYPFIDEKYAQVAVPVPGAMENQTCTHINTNYDWGDWEVIEAHELSHSWWGNSTTCRKLKHMWLNEGFATYSAALWVEHRDGPQTYQEYYETEIAAPYLASFNIQRYPILDPPWQYIYSELTYEKPAAVLHMLRRIVGDEDFFDILQTYGERFRDSTALSEDFEAVVNEISGKDYSWFFDEWLRKPGHPRYMMTWSSQDMGDSSLLTIHLRQTQDWPPEVPIFKMPVEFGVVEGQDTAFVWFIDSLADQTFSMLRATSPSEVIFDPHGNILKTTQTGVREAGRDRELTFEYCLISRGRVEYNSDSNQPLNLYLYDARGGMVRRWKGLEPTGYIDLSSMPAGVYFLRIGQVGLGTRRIVIVH